MITFCFCFFFIHSEYFDVTCVRRMNNDTEARAIPRRVCTHNIIYTLGLGSTANAPRVRRGPSGIDWSPSPGEPESILSPSLSHTLASGPSPLPKTPSDYTANLTPSPPLKLYPPGHPPTNPPPTRVKTCHRLLYIPPRRGTRTHTYT